MNDPKCTNILNTNIHTMHNMECLRGHDFLECFLYLVSGQEFSSPGPKRLIVFPTPPNPRVCSFHSMESAGMELYGPQSIAVDYFNNSTKWDIVSRTIEHIQRIYIKVIRKKQKKYYRKVEFIQFRSAWRRNSRIVKNKETIERNKTKSKSFSFTT